MQSRADLNGDNLRISRANFRISDYCRVTVRVGITVRVRVSIRVSVRVEVADCCIQTAGKGDKMWINHVIKTDKWRSAPEIRPALHFVVSLKITNSCLLVLADNLKTKPIKMTFLSG